MFSSLNPLIAAISALVPGIIIGYLARHIITSRRASQAESRAEALLADSKSKSQDILLEAKKEALKILEEAKKEEKDRNAQLLRIENLLTKKESELEQQSKKLTAEYDSLKAKTAEISTAKAELEQGLVKQINELERIAQLNKESAKEELFKKIEEANKDELYKKLIKLEQETKEELDKKAREILTLAIQRYSGSHIADATTTVVSLPSDEVKGKIIGKEG